MAKSSKDIKELKSLHDTHKKEFEKTHKKLAKQDTLFAETENKISAVDYYNSLSDTEKREFQDQLQKKKLRESYISYLKYVYGDKYIITPFHKVLANICQSVVERIEKGQKIRICLSVPPRHGKGYPIDFPVLTTKGWKKHGELEVGDYVYNDKGEQVMVLGNQKPYMWHCCKITFSTGEEHIITREHLWKVLLSYETRRSNGVKRVHSRERRENILETQDLMLMLPKCKRKPSIMINAPLQNKHKELPINPYVLGLWLGDGISKSNEIVVGDEDLQQELLGIGDKEIYSVYKKPNNPNVSYIKLGRKIGNTCEFNTRLRSLGLYDNKHIPMEYLLSSEEQRWELLRGLMDTDGTCNYVEGRCEFCNINKELAMNVFTLLRSLGIKATINEYDAKLYGRFISKKYRVIFTASKGQKVFHIERKQQKIERKLANDRIDKCEYFIKSIEPVEDELVSCISVEGGMYLAGYGLIPTHNSQTVSNTLPSWFLGRNPDKSVIITGYNADIAENFGNNNRELVRQFGKDIFGIEISDSQDNKTEFAIKKNSGYCLSVGLLGGITGRGGSLIIVDDPFKNGEEANNPTIRERISSVFKDSVLTRLEGKGNAVIVIHTRWHEEDLIGELENTGNWLVINIPAVWESGVDKLLHRKIGQTLCPELGYDSEWATLTEQAIGKKKWLALYQGKPYIESGELVKRDSIQVYDEKSKPMAFEELTLSCDLSFGGTKNSNDPVCLTVWGRNGGNHYLLKVINKVMTFTETLNQIRNICNQYPQMAKKLVERKANGAATIETLNREIGGFVPFEPGSKSKIERLELCLPYFEAHNVFFPNEKIEPNIEDYIQQLLRFPKATHDDFVDTISQYLLNYQYKYSGRILTNNSYSTISDAFRGVKI